jgi:hypothetical protein
MFLYIRILDSWIFAVNMGKLQRNKKLERRNDKDKSRNDGKKMKREIFTHALAIIFGSVACFAIANQSLRAYESQIQDLTDKNFILAQENQYLNDLLSDYYNREEQNITVSKNKITIAQGEKREESYVPDAGAVEIKVNERGDTAVAVKDYGVCLQPYIMGCYSINTQNCLKMGVGLEFEYWKNYGFSAGVEFDAKEGKIKPFAAISRRLNDILGTNNIGVGVFCDPEVEVCLMFFM